MGQQFCFFLGNHSEVGQRSLEDVIAIFGHQINALGHKAVWDASNTKLVSGADGINVIVEGFTKDSVNLVANAAQQGARWIILATEEPSERGFNQGTQREMVYRQERFPDAAKYCEGILHLVPGEHVTKWYGQFAPAAPIELGYAPTLVRITDKEPDYEFGFYGSLTPRRHSILKRLAKRVGTEKAVRLVVDFATQQERDETMRRAKVIIQVRKFESMGLVSSSRCNTALCLGRPVVAEPHLLSKPWDEVVRFSDTIEGFYSQCLLVRAAWRGVWASQFEKFKAKFPPEVCVGRALDHIGVLDPARVKKAVAA
jgi:hypothetical protein